MALTSLGIASHGLLDRGGAPTLHIASMGLLRIGDGGAVTSSGVSRLAKAGYFSRVSGARGYIPAILAKLPAKSREEIEEIREETPQEVIEAAVNALAAFKNVPIGPKRKEKVVQATENAVGSVDPDQIARIIAYRRVFEEIERRRKDENDMAILLLSM